MDIDLAMKQVRGVKRSQRDPARGLALLQQLREAFRKDGRFKGMTDAQILRQARQTREEVWSELKHASGPRR